MLRILRDKNKGFIAISAVLIILSVITAMALSLSLLSIGESQGSFAQTKGRENIAFLDSCVEDALLKLWASSAYTGGNITYPTGICVVTVSSGSGTYTINITTTATDYKKTINLNVTRGSTITINSWIEN